MSKSLPLAGIKVFDLTTAAAGPWSTLLLGALGADVLRIEPPRPDIAVSVPPRVHGMGVLYIACNMNKRTVALDLTDPGDRAKADRLLASADVFVENMRPGAAKKLDLDHESLSAQNPGIVTVSISGYGQRGPMATEACTDPLAQAYCGWTSITGSPGGRGEFLRYYAQVDLTTASFAAEAVLLALFERTRTGVGKHIEVALVQSGIALQSTRIAEYLATGTQPLPAGSAAASTAPNQAFHCEDRRWIAVAVESDEQWSALVDALAVPGLGAPEYASNAARVRNRDALAATLSDVFAARPARHWLLLLGRAGVPAAPMLGYDQLEGHKQIAANGLLIEQATPWGPLGTVAAPWAFDGARPTLTASPLPGSGNAEWIGEGGAE